MLLQSCRTLNHLKQIQTRTIIASPDDEWHYTTPRFLSKCLELKYLRHAGKVFDQVPNRNTSLWNLMSKGYLQNGLYNEVVALFVDMMRENVKPNVYTLPMVLKSCVKLLAWMEGEQLHGVAVKNGFKSSNYVGTSLIELYSGRGEVQSARRVFSEMVLRNVVAWTAMITGYVENGDLVSARKLFDLAPERDIVLWNRMLSVYLERGNMLQALELFEMMPDKDLMSWNTLLNGYANTGDVEGCERLFKKMSERNIFSWNALIGGYARNGHLVKVIDTFRRMVRDTQVQPNDATFVNVLTACARLGALELGKWVHLYAESIGYSENVFVCNGLIDMYAKCGAIGSAIEVFRGMDKKDLISWNAIINGLAMHGNGPYALSLFNEMKGAGEKPDGITFIGLLCACSHMGLVVEGFSYFDSMVNEYSIEPQIEHYGCVVDLLARAGHLEHAVHFIQKMPIKADAVIWTSLLGAARIHKNVKLAELALEKLIQLDPENPANYVTLSNVYGDAQKWDCLARSKVTIRDIGSKKFPGRSVIESEDGVAEFYSYDERHAKAKEIYSTLRGLLKLLRSFEYAPDLVEIAQGP